MSYLIEGIRSLIIKGWDGEALALGFGFALALAVISARASRAFDADAAGARMRGFLSVTEAVSWRSIHNTIVSPSILLPSIIFPLFFLVAFAGGLSRIADVPNFNYKPGLHVVPVRVRVPPIGGVRRRVHRVRAWRATSTRGSRGACC